MSKAIENFILSHPKDNVATARSPLGAGTLLRVTEQKTIVAREQIPFGHKIALQKIHKGGSVIKYGERIGRASREIKPGEWVHIHNVAGERGRSKAKDKGHGA
jgi:altronate dehydratase